LDPLTVIIPFRDGHTTLPALLDDLVPCGWPVLIVDDQSQTPITGSWPERISVLRLGQRGYFAGAINTAMQATRGDVLVLNQDMRLSGTEWQSWLAEQVGRYAIAGTAQMRHPAWPAGYVQGQFMYLARAAWETVGELNTRDYPLWGNTCEWQLRAVRKSWLANPVPMVPGVVHARSAGVAFGDSIAQALRQEPDKRSLLVRTPPLVSVIVTSQSYGRYLPDCLNSLLGGDTSLGHMPGQSLQSFEVIIVDDASTDETAEVGKALADDRLGVHYIRREVLGGTPAANNTGIRSSYGPFVTIVCADDMREPDSLEALYRVVERNPKAVAYDNLYEFANGARTSKQKLPPAHGNVPSFSDLLQKNSMHAGIMFARQAWEEVGGYPEAMRYGREDWAFNIALGAKGYCGERVPGFGYLYRREGQNRSLTNQGPEWHQKFMSQLRELFPALYQGVRPMGCCGGGDPRPVPQGARNASSQPLLLSELGSEGMTLLQFLGSGSSSQPWYGPVTGARYMFGGNRPQGYVDNRDVAGMLAMVVNKHPVFNLAPTPPPLAQPVLTTQEAQAPVDLVSENGKTGAEKIEALGEVAAAAPEPVAAKKTSRKSTKKAKNAAA